MWSRVKKHCFKKLIVFPKTHCFPKKPIVFQYVHFFIPLFWNEKISLIAGLRNLVRSSLHCCRRPGCARNTSSSTGSTCTSCCSPATTSNWSRWAVTRRPPAHRRVMYRTSSFPADDCRCLVAGFRNLKWNITVMELFHLILMPRRVVLVNDSSVRQSFNQSVRPSVPFFVWSITLKLYNASTWNFIGRYISLRRSVVYT